MGDCLALQLSLIAGQSSATEKRQINNKSCNLKAKAKAKAPPQKDKIEDTKKKKKKEKWVRNGAQSIISNFKMIIVINLALHLEPLDFL